ncbi:MAG: hypothetical protein IJP29_05840 [Lachnospiraceae bacterium]|nr:hypothetical protein [Lachnospiraceae bacterium]
MEKNTGLFVTLGILVFLVLILAVLIGALAWQGKEKTDEQGQNNQTDSGHISSGQASNEAQDTSEEMHFVLSGYEFVVPGNYDMTYADAVGTVIFKENIFQMKMAVVDNSYKEVMGNPQKFTQETVDAGGSIVQDMKETEIDEKKYAYYCTDLNGETMLVIYTAAPEEDQRIAGQIVLQGENVTDEDMLQIFAGIASSAEKTDKADSTKDDIVVEMAEKKPSSIEREWIAESAMQFGDAKATHKVPDNFFVDDTYEGAEYVAERYYMVEPRVDVTCSLFDIPWYDNVKDYIEKSKHLDDTKVQTMNIGGNKVYYIVETFVNGDETYQQIYAGCDLGEQQFYVVEAYVMDEDIELTMGVIREFLVLQ